MLVDYAKLAVSIGICLSVGLIGSFLTVHGINDWYPTLTKPALTPPSWVFAPVWTALYVLAGLSLYLIWKSRKSKPRTFLVFGANLVLNLLWSFLFFGLRSPILALVDVIALWGSIIIVIHYFGKADSKTVLLLAPYLVWVSFATYLNYEIAILNP